MSDSSLNRFGKQSNQSGYRNMNKLQTLVGKKQSMSKLVKNEKKSIAKIAKKIAKPRLKKMSAPVALGSSTRTTFYRISHTGDDVVVHCRDRLPLVEIDTTVASVAEINVSGRILLALPLNPAGMGERLRRLAANYEFYRFESAVATYEGATGSAAIGSILGFFDQDPVDGFDAGARSLVEAASHPGAHSIKVWETGIWNMPPRVGGRYYIDNSGHSAADRRLQEQGVFRIMLDIPLLASTLSSETHNALGSVYMEYRVRLMKPALMPNFVGTCDLITWPAAASINAAAASVTNIIETYHAAGYMPSYDPRSNGGSRFEVNSASTGATISITEGIWNVSFGATLTLPKATAGSVYNLIVGAAASFGGVPGEAEVDSHGTSASAATGGGCNKVITSATAALVLRRCNFGFQMLVPADATYRLTIGITFVSGTDTLTIVQPEITLTSVFANSTQLDLINPDSVDLSERLRSLETKLNRLTGDTAPDSDTILVKMHEEKAWNPIFDRGSGRITTPSPRASRSMK